MLPIFIAFVESRTDGTTESFEVEAGSYREAHEKASQACLPHQFVRDVTPKIHQPY